MVSVEDMLVVCACSVPGGNRKHICPRTLRHFSVFAVSPLTDETITKIFSTLLFTGFKVSLYYLIITCYFLYDILNQSALLNIFVTFRFVYNILRFCFDHLGISTM